MARPPKLTQSRRARLVAILSLGESMMAACRAIDVTPAAVRRAGRRDPFFAVQLAAARVREPAPTADDWSAVARFLEVEHPERWSLP